MGVKGLHSYISRRAKPITESVNLSELGREARKNGTDRPLVLIDGYSFIFLVLEAMVSPKVKYLSAIPGVELEFNPISFAARMLAGDFRVYVQFFEHFLDKFQEDGISLMVFYDPPPGASRNLEDRFATWSSRFERRLEDFGDVFDFITEIQNDAGWFDVDHYSRTRRIVDNLLPPGIRLELDTLYKARQIPVIALADVEADITISCTSLALPNVVGVLSGDTDFAMIKGSALLMMSTLEGTLVESESHTNGDNGGELKGDICVQRIGRERLAEVLQLDEEVLTQLALLCGSDLTIDIMEEYSLHMLLGIGSRRTVQSIASFLRSHPGFSLQTSSELSSLLETSDLRSTIEKAEMMYTDPEKCMEMALRISPDISVSEGFLRTIGCGNMYEQLTAERERDGGTKEAIEALSSLSPEILSSISLVSKGMWPACVVGLVRDCKLWSTTYVSPPMYSPLHIDTVLEGIRMQMCVLFGIEKVCIIQRGTGESGMEIEEKQISIASGGRQNSVCGIGDLKKLIHTPLRSVFDVPNAQKREREMCCEEILDTLVGGSQMAKARDAVVFPLGGEKEKISVAKWLLLYTSLRCAEAGYNLSLCELEALMISLALSLSTRNRVPLPKVSCVFDISDTNASSTSLTLSRDEIPTQNAISTFSVFSAVYHEIRKIFQIFGLESLTKSLPSEWMNSSIYMYALHQLTTKKWKYTVDSGCMEAFVALSPCVESNKGKERELGLAISYYRELRKAIVEGLDCFHTQQSSQKVIKNDLSDTFPAYICISLDGERERNEGNESVSDTDTGIADEFEGDGGREFGSVLPEEVEEDIDDILIAPLKELDIGREKERELKKAAGKEGDALPISAFEDEIISSMRAHKVVFIHGETGCGKSTMVPLFMYRNRRLLMEGQKGRKLKILVTQPRRLAAISLAKRTETLLLAERERERDNERANGVSSERAREMEREEAGDHNSPLVGYRISRDIHTSPSTVIEYATTGYMLQYLSLNPKNLRKYTHIVLDEVHERSLDADLLNLFLKMSMEGEREGDGDSGGGIRLVVMSATLQGDVFRDYFGGAGRYGNDGEVEELEQDVPDSHEITVRRYPVTSVYLEEIDKDSGNYVYTRPGRDGLSQLTSYFRALPPVLPVSIPRLPKGYEVLVSDLILCLSATRPGECILCFLPGLAEIEHVYETMCMDARFSEERYAVHLLHSSVPREEQDAAMKPLSAPDTPDGTSASTSLPTKVILATNIAESSLTISDATIVIDSGLQRDVLHDPARNLSSLVTRWCSKASAKQRKGRVGRCQPGTVIHLYPLSFYNDVMEAFASPEMERLSLENLVLNVTKNFQKFGETRDILRNSLSPPDPKDVELAIQRLHITAALYPSPTVSTTPETLDTHTHSSLVLSPLGGFASNLPIDLKCASLLYYGLIFGVAMDSIIIASAISIQSPFIYVNPMYVDSIEDYNRKLSKRFMTTAYYDAGHFSEPIMWMHMFYDYVVAVGERERERGRSDDRGIVPDRSYGFISDWMSRRGLSNIRFREFRSLIRNLAESMLAYVREVREKYKHARSYEVIPIEHREMYIRLEDRGFYAALTSDLHFLLAMTGRLPSHITLSASPSQYLRQRFASQTPLPVSLTPSLPNYNLLKFILLVSFKDYTLTGTAVPSSRWKNMAKQSMSPVRTAGGMAKGNAAKADPKRLEKEFSEAFDLHVRRVFLDTGRKVFIEVGDVDFEEMFYGSLTFQQPEWQPMGQVAEYAGARFLNSLPQNGKLRLGRTQLLKVNGMLTSTEQLPYASERIDARGAQPGIGGERERVEKSCVEILPRTNVEWAMPGYSLSPPLPGEKQKGGRGGGSGPQIALEKDFIGSVLVDCTAGYEDIIALSDMKGKREKQKLRKAEAFSRFVVATELMSTGSAEGSRNSQKVLHRMIRASGCTVIEPVNAMIYMLASLTHNAPVGDSTRDEMDLMAAADVDSDDVYLTAKKNLSMYQTIVLPSPVPDTIDSGGARPSDIPRIITAVSPVGSVSRTLVLAPYSMFAHEMCTVVSMQRLLVNFALGTAVDTMMGSEGKMHKRERERMYESFAFAGMAAWNSIDRLCSTVRQRADSGGMNSLWGKSGSLPMPAGECDIMTMREAVSLWRMESQDLLRSSKPDLEEFDRSSATSSPSLSRSSSRSSSSSSARKGRGGRSNATQSWRSQGEAVNRREQSGQERPGRSAGGAQQPDWRASGLREIGSNHRIDERHPLNQAVYTPPHRSSSSHSDTPSPRYSPRQPERLQPTAPMSTHAQRNDILAVQTRNGSFPMTPQSQQTPTRQISRAQRGRTGDATAYKRPDRDSRAGEEDVVVVKRESPLDVLIGMVERGRETLAAEAGKVAPATGVRRDYGGEGNKGAIAQENTSGKSSNATHSRLPPHNENRSADGENGTLVRVSGLEDYVSTEALRIVFEPYGLLRATRTTTLTKKPRGFSILTFSTHEKAREVIQAVSAGQISACGKQWRLQWERSRGPGAERERERERESRAPARAQRDPGPQSKCKTLRLWGLEPSVTPELLRNVFGPHGLQGASRTTTLAKNPRGFSILTFNTYEEARAVIHSYTQGSLLGCSSAWRMAWEIPKAQKRFGKGKKGERERERRHKK